MSLFPPPLPVSVAVVCSSAPALWPACEPTAFAMHCEIIMAIWQRCPVEYRGGWVGGHAECTGWASRQVRTSRGPRANVVGTMPAMGTSCESGTGAPQCMHVCVAMRLHVRTGAPQCMHVCDHAFTCVCAAMRFICVCMCVGTKCLL
jgi:hypothetical protein